VYEALLDLGVEAANLEFTHNDLLYKGKKFMGNEQIVEAGVFSENTIITLEYTPEKEIFERLTGKYALTRGITGIIEETQCFTKEQFIDKLVEKITAFVNTLE
jgi:lipoate-protein ligase A